MQDETPPIERRGDDYLLRLEGTERRYRVTVPRGMLDDEVGHGTSEEERREWIRAHLAEIIGDEAGDRRHRNPAMGPPCR